jgi:fructokinase
MIDQAPLVAGVELGGTKCICMLGTGPEDVRDEVVIPTTDPAATLAAIRAVLKRWHAGATPFEAIGIASFGPLDLRRSSKTYGYITSTAKPGWQYADVLGTLTDGLAVPVGFDTDVNGAAVAEGLWGGARGLNHYAYITVGTGIGVGLVVDDKPMMGFSHAELGHTRIGRQAGDDWSGACPYHGDCVEGLASGSAIAARTGTPGATLPADHPVWSPTAHALGQMLHNLVLTAAPERILMGGGVVEAQQHLLPMIRQEMVRSINGYMVAEQLDGGLDSYVALSSLGGKAGPLGAMALAMSAYERRVDVTLFSAALREKKAAVVAAG